MIPPKIYKLCHNGVSISSELAKNPTEAPSAVCKRVFGVNIEDDIVESDKLTRPIEGSSDLDQALECGNWGGSKPSELFLKIYHDVLGTLDRNPLIGVCSPSLMGSNGVCPLTIISTIPDVCRHMSNVIARAEREVFLATNFWTFSEPSKLITNSLRELSRKAVERERRVVVKIIYDRGNIKQVYNNHQAVSPEDYSDKNGKVQIPHPDELPNIDLEVVNYHRPIFGTFHAKYLVVDRKIAIMQSNNIMDNDNLEMMTQFEGAIVDSLYDTALISWHNAMKSPLPCLDTPAATAPLPTFHSEEHATLFNEKGDLVPVYQTTSPIPKGDRTQADIASHASQLSLAQHTSVDPHYDPDIASEVLRSISVLYPTPPETPIDSITRLLNTTIQPNTRGTFTPSATHPLDATTMFTPLIPIPSHAPFPIAMVNREPFGAPTHSSLHTPQNTAFLSALAHAKESVYIQTPNLNSPALLPAILAACRRGIKVTYTYTLGYNDAGELLPFQNGHNESIAHSLLTSLASTPASLPNLSIHVYIARDHLTPIHNSHKSRSSHIKLLVADGHLGIQGNGNQDTQSWYHSQETNLMIDSPLVVGKWMEGIRRNQNTFLFGEVVREGERAGCWVHPQTGDMAPGSIGVDAGRFSWMKGVTGAVARVRGAGGF